MPIVINTHKLSKLQREILKKLSKKPINNQTEFAEITGSKQPSISRSLRTLIRDKVVQKNSINQYIINKELINQINNWDEVSYQNLIEILRRNEFINSDYIFNKSQMDSIKWMIPSEIEKTFAMSSAAQAALVGSSIKTQMESLTLATRSIAESSGIREMIEIGKEAFKNSSIFSAAYKDLNTNFKLTESTLNALGNAKEAVAFILAERKDLLSGISSNLLLGMNQNISSMIDQLPVGLLKHHNQITKTFQIHTELFPEPYNKNYFDEYDDKEYNFASDYLYRSTVPIKPLIYPEQELEIISPPPKSLFIQKIEEISPRLKKIDPILPVKIFGAVEGYQNKNPDYLSHSAVSMRSLTNIILNKLSPRRIIAEKKGKRIKDITLKDQIDFMLGPNTDKLNKKFLLENTNLLFTSHEIFDKLIHEGEITSKSPNKDIAEASISMSIEYIILLVKSLEL